MTAPFRELLRPSRHLLNLTWSRSSNRTNIKGPLQETSSRVYVLCYRRSVHATKHEGRSRWRARPAFKAWQMSRDAVVATPDTSQDDKSRSR
jgi:hypothetical protein